MEVVTDDTKIARKRTFGPSQNKQTCFANRQIQLKPLWNDYAGKLGHDFYFSKPQFIFKIIICA